MPIKPTKKSLNSGSITAIVLLSLLLLTSLAGLFEEFSVAVLFLFLISACGIAYFIVRLVHLEKLESVSFDVYLLNEQLNKAVGINKYYYTRDLLFDALNTLLRYRKWTGRKSRLDKHPAKIMQELQINESLSVAAMLRRTSASYKETVKNTHSDMSGVYEAELSKNLSRLDSNNRTLAYSLLNDLKTYERLAGTINEADNMEGHDFEYWCADLLRKNGFVDVEVTPGSGDQGVDVLAKKDGIKYAIQCKCYSSDLGNKPVQEVNTGKAIYHCQVGAVMTNRYFTASAKEAAEATGTLLWDRDALESMLKS